MNMKPDMTLLYVEDVGRSADFYAKLFEITPIERSNGFAMFKLEGGPLVGLWRRDGVKPLASQNGGGGEIAFALSDRQAVIEHLEAWRAKGAIIAQEPEEMDFGFTGVALDPDGHRLRLFHPSQR